MKLDDLLVPKHRSRALILVTSQFLLDLNENLYAAEFELAIRKNRQERENCAHVNYLHDYCDANQVLLDSMQRVFPNDDIDPTHPMTGGFLDAVYDLATKWCGEVWR